MAEPFIKIYRKMLKWEWYDDVNTKVLFLHCLLKANWQETRWHGVVLQPGQFITSLPSLSKETKLTIQQVRTALDHLKSTGEVTDKPQAKFRIITVIKWDEYQGDNRISNRIVTGKQQDDNRQVTADKEYKELKNKKNIYKSAPKRSAAEKVGGNTREYSHEFYEELERQAALDPWGARTEDD